MAQRRPDRMSDNELFADWLKTMERIYDEMIALGQNRRMFKMMRDVVQRNERIQQTGGHVVEWMFNNYALAAAMSFRRDLDRDASTAGLLNLLHEIEGRPTIVNRSRYRAQWNIPQTDEVERYICDRAFDGFEPMKYRDQPERDHVNPTVVELDRRQLLEKTERVRAYVEQTFAHRARGEVDTVTWGDFHEAVDALVNVFRKYYSLLTQATITDIEPAPQYDTHECFTFAWWVEPQGDG